MFCTMPLVGSGLSIDRDRLRSALRKTTAALLAERAPEGHWTGELSSSALSTATAVTALAIYQRERGTADSTRAIDNGLEWLAQHVNDDGGWGDTVRSISNLSTTTLCWAAFGVVPGAADKHRDLLERTEAWIQKHAGGIDPERLAPAIIRRYGKDRTFSVPILTMCALAGRLGKGPAAWRHVIPLPFELAAFPHQWFATLRLPVVSYALPALIAIGQARHVHRPSRNPFIRLLRRAARQRTLDVLTSIQPANGGFLEATPLTSFVVLSLAGSGQAGHTVARKGVEFLTASQRADGSWPIDTNLATWVTTLAIDALPAMPDAAPVLRWLLDQQYQSEHPYTHAAPGAWAWTNLPGGVPDADDTSGALLALRRLSEPADATRRAARGGIQWLLDLQNRDGGIPTFCRGWGALPFDRSSADITAHAMRAWLAWMDQMPPDSFQRMKLALIRALDFLVSVQREDGAWVPLWFGNQLAPDDENPTYGTSRVLNGLSELARAMEERRFQTAGATPSLHTALRRGTDWLLDNQNADGGWSGLHGGPGSIEETALAIDALGSVLVVARSVPDLRRDAMESSIARGVAWLLGRIDTGSWREPAPIGFYFAKLWYFEKLYPVIFTTGALGRVLSLLESS